MFFDVLVSICSLLSQGNLGYTGTGSPIVNHVGPSTSHREGYNMASADSSENLQPSQRNDGPEPATIARDRSLQTTRGKYSRRGTCDTTDIYIANKNWTFWTFWTFCHVFQRAQFKYESSIIWKNEHNFRIIWPKSEQCY